jgi:hypothetical protein
MVTKNETKLFLGTLLIFLIASCGSSIDQKETLIGMWTIDSMLNYYNGEENIIIPESDEKLIIGTSDNPRIWCFNNYDELVDYRVNNYEKRLVSSFSVVADSLSFTTRGSASLWLIESVNSSNLVLVNQFDGFNSKNVTKFYFSKRKIDDFENQIIGSWEFTESYNNFSSEVTRNTVDNVQFEITSDSILYSTDKLHKHSYRIEGDSLVINGWATFYLQELTNDVMTWSVNDYLNKAAGIYSTNKLFFEKHNKE